MSRSATNTQAGRTASMSMSSTVSGSNTGSVLRPSADSDDDDDDGLGDLIYRSSVTARVRARAKAEEAAAAKQTAQARARAAAAADAAKEATENDGGGPPPRQRPPKPTPPRRERPEPAPKQARQPRSVEGLQSAQVRALLRVRAQAKEASKTARVRARPAAVAAKKSATNDEEGPPPRKKRPPEPAQQRMTQREQPLEPPGRQFHVGSLQPVSQQQMIAAATKQEAQVRAGDVANQKRTSRNGEDGPPQPEPPQRQAWQQLVAENLRSADRQQLIRAM